MNSSLTHHLVAVCLVLLSQMTRADTPGYIHDKNSVLLKQMGFEMRSKWAPPESMASCEALFDAKAKIAPEDSIVTLVFTDDIGSILLQSGHSLGRFTSYLEKGFDQGHFTHRFCFRFSIKPDLLRRAYLMFEYTGLDKTGKDMTGFQILPLSNFIPDYTPMEEAEQKAHGEGRHNNGIDGVAAPSSLPKAEPAGADQPATKPADKVPAKVQPPNPTSKDSPR